MSERRTHEYVTKEGRGHIHTRYVTDLYREKYDQIRWKGKKSKKMEVQSNAVREGEER